MFERDKSYDDYSGPDKETILSDDTRFKGSLEFSHKLIINGHFEGNLQSKGILTIGSSGQVKAEIKVGSVIIEGKVWGNITAEDKIELRSSAELYGDITARRLVINEGATFTGQSDVNPNRKETTASTSTNSPSNSSNISKKPEQPSSGDSKNTQQPQKAEDKNKQQHLLKSL